MREADGTGHERWTGKQCGRSPDLVNHTEIRRQRKIPDRQHRLEQERKYRLLEEISSEDVLKIHYSYQLNTAALRKINCDLFQRTEQNLRVRDRILEDLGDTKTWGLHGSH